MQKYVKNSFLMLFMFFSVSSLFAQDKMLLSNVKTFIGHEKAVEYIDFSPSGDRVASAGHDLSLIHI